MATGILFILTAIVLFSQVRAVHRPNIFIPSSGATCLSDYAWMNNAEQKDPCLAVAYVIAACVGDTWTQPALPTGYKYDAPNGTTATPCYCSWSCYNLMMACTVCQNPAYIYEITAWPSFSELCPSNYKDEVFPQGYVLFNNISIPFWATTDPTSWPSELFNITLAHSYANQSAPDYYPSSLSSDSSSSSSSSNNRGAIIGGTIGGVVVLLLILLGGYFLYKRRKYQRLRQNNTATSILNMGSPMTTHTSWPSDPSSIFRPTLLEGSPPLMPYEASSFSSPPPPTETASFLTTGNTVVQRTRAIPMV